MSPMATFQTPLTDRTGMNTSSESPSPYRLEANAPAAESVPSSYEIDGLFLRGITVLREAVEAASKARVHEDIQRLIGILPTTPDLESASPSMQRLTGYFSLIVTLATELRSIAPMPLAQDAGDSLRDQESFESSTPEVCEWWNGDDPEPAYQSIVTDDSGDAWQRHWEGWTCTVGTDTYKGWSWEKLTSNYRVRVLRAGIES